MSSLPRVPLREQPAGTYAHDQLQALEQEARHAMSEHLMAAADYLTAVLSGNKIPYAIMGGFSLRIRGSNRETYDVDIAVGCDMSRLIQVLAPQHRILRPLGPVSGVMRIFVKTGGPYEPELPDLFGEVDLILRGCLGAPEDLEAASEVVSRLTQAGTRQDRRLNLHGRLAAKLGAAYARSSQNDFDDILFLITQYPAEVRDLRRELSNSQRQHFINHLYRSSAQRSVISKAQHVFGIAGFVQL